MTERFEYDEILHELPEKGGAYVIFPWDIREKFGKGRIRVHALFDGQPYDGSIVNMGVKTPDGNICYIIGCRAAVRQVFAAASQDLCNENRSHLI